MADIVPRDVKKRKRAFQIGPRAGVERRGDAIKENDGGIGRNNPKQSGMALMNKGLGGGTFRETG